MRNPRQQKRALFALTLDPVAHFQKRGARRADFRGPARAIGDDLALAEGFGDMGQLRDRAQLATQEEHRQQAQQQPGCQHQDKDMVGVAGRDPFAVHPDAQGLTIPFQPDGDPRSVGAGIDGYKLGQAQAEHMRDIAALDIQPGHPILGRRGCIGRDLQPDGRAQFRQPGHGVGALADRGQQPQFQRHPFGHLPGDPFDMALDKDNRDDDLDDDNGGQHDQRGATVNAPWQG